MRLTDKQGIQPELRSALTTFGEVGIPLGTPVNAVASTAILQVTTNPTAGEEITIGNVTYTFVANGTAPLLVGDIELEALVADTRPNIVLAINGTDGHNVLNPFATAGAFAGANSTLTATVAGVSGDDIVTATDMVGVDNSISVFANGVDGSLGVPGAVCADADRIYVAIAENTISGANWRRIPVALQTF
jgi:hypothetical protein